MNAQSANAADAATHVVDMASGLLSEHQRLPTSGARTALPVRLDGDLLLYVPQLSEDLPDTPPHMNGGNSDVDMIVYRWTEGSFVEHERLPTPGGEDVLIFAIGGETYMGTASIRTGSGPYEMNAFASIYKRIAGAWTLHQTIPAFAAKQLYFFSFDGRHFLGLAQGVTLPHAKPTNPRESTIFEWDGTRFVLFQAMEGKWGYNWHFFERDGQRFLAYADHTSPSLVYRWEGTAFTPFQEFSPTSGRAFATFERNGELYLLHAAIDLETTLHRWDGAAFVQEQVLGGPSGREFALIPSEDALYLVRVCFILGTPQDPKTDLSSQIYRWDDGKFVLAGEFATNGATDANLFEADGQRYLVISNSLTPEPRFRQDAIVYRLNF